MLRSHVGACIAGLMLVILIPFNSHAAGPFEPKNAWLQNAVGAVLDSRARSQVHEDPQRAVALGLALTLGAFGAHRLYFGTDAKVPIAYGLTFGGFGVLVLIDVCHILFSQDLARFRANDRVFMWAPDSKEKLTPP